MSTSRIPTLLEPYLDLPPPSSLVLLTGVLGASTNWLVLRWLYALLKGSGSGGGQGSDEGSEASTGVVLVSFLRDSAFWKEGSSKLGLDLEGLRKTGKFTYVDGLTGLFTAGNTPALQNGAQHVLRSSGGIEGVRKSVEEALAQLKTGKKVLILDQPDVLLAASGDETGSQAVHNLILQLRENVHATILTLAADDPLVHTQHTTLEKEHAALLAGQAHAADGWAGLRMLDTGVARDVSGVVRWARKEGGTFDSEGGGSRWEEREMLYWVGADGGVKVFERGTA